MIITCPHCQTKYQVTYEAIGSTGRKVQCAQCQQAWRQVPLQAPSPEPEPVAIDPLTEDGLDEAIEAEEREASPMPAGAKRRKWPGSEPVGAVDPAVIRQRQRDFTQRQSAVNAQLPLARLRRAVRVLGVLTLAGLAVFAVWGRVEIVKRYPSLAGVYSAAGLPVNVVGLDFGEVKTLRTLQGGKEVLLVSAQIAGTSDRAVPVPPLVVTLLNGAGAGIYEWSVAANAPMLKAGEQTLVETLLTVPPAEAERVRLSFASGRADSDDVRPVAAAPEPAAAAEPAHEVEQH
ncbi:zinc-ribbon domain-containing protein [Devosia sp. 1566]|uniref:zinc-ribbon domain-containing protein n=1 Tax=Devosia sp. 1566 TaxID=2499144 RepID=UPI000FD89EB9|nr:zinc-ribbon domain-containing protein [Devosia sp. 1566]